MADKGIILTANNLKAFNQELENFLKVSTDVSGRLSVLAKNFKEASEELSKDKIAQGINNITRAFMSFDKTSFVNIGGNFTKNINELNSRGKDLIKLSKTFSGVTFENFRSTVKDLLNSLRTLTKINDVATLIKVSSVEKLNNFTIKFSEFINNTNKNLNTAKLQKINEIYKQISTFATSIKNAKNAFSSLDDLSWLVTSPKIIFDIIKKFSEYKDMPDISKLRGLQTYLKSFSIMINDFSKSMQGFKAFSEFNISADEIKNKLKNFNELVNYMFGKTSDTDLDNILSGIDSAKNVKTGTGILSKGYDRLNKFVQETTGVGEKITKLAENNKFAAIMKKSGEALNSIKTNVLDASILNERKIGSFITGFLTTDNLYPKLGKVKPDAFKSLELLPNALRSITDLMKGLSEITIDEAKIKEAFNKINIFSELFVGTNLFGKIFNIYSETAKQSSKFQAKSGLMSKLMSPFKSIGNLAVRVFAPSSILDRFKNIDFSTIESISKFSNSLMSFMNAIKEMNNIDTNNINTEKFKEIKFILSEFSKNFTGLTRLEKFTNLFTGSGFNKIFGLFDNGILGRFNKFNLTAVNKFTDSIEAVQKIFRVIVQLENLPRIDEEKLNNFRESLSFVTRLFTGSGFLDKFTDAFRGSSGFLGFAKSIGSAVFKSIFNISSVLNRMGNVKDSSVMNLTRLSRAVIQLSNVIKNMSDVTISYQVVRQNLKIMKEVLNTFADMDLGGNIITNSVKKIAGLFGFDFGAGKKIDKFKNLTTGIKYLAEALTLVSRLRIDKGRIQEFINASDMIIKGMNRSMKGSMFDNFMKGMSTEAFKKTGQLTKSMAEGLTVNSANMVNAGKASAKQYIDGFKKTAEIKSPSRVFMRLGGFMVDGLLQGFKRGFGVVINFFKNSLNNISNVFKNAFDKIKNYISGVFTKINQTASNSGQSIFNSFSDLSFRLNNVFDFINRMFNFDNLKSAAVIFESQMASIFKAMPLGEMGAEGAKEFTDAFTLRIKEMATSPEFGTAFLDNAIDGLTQIGEAAATAGIKAENLELFIQTIGNLAQTTNLTADEAGRMIAGFSVVTRTEEYDRIGATLVDLGNNFNATERTITEFAERLGGLAAGSELTVSDILALSAAMGSVGINAEAGGTSMTQFINEITKAASSMQVTKIATEDYTNSLRGNISALEEERIGLERKLMAAQDRLNRATTLSARISAEDAITKYQNELNTINSSISSINNNIQAAPLDGFITSVGGASKELMLFAEVSGLTAQEFAQGWQDEPIKVIEQIISGFSEMSNMELTKLLEDMGLDAIRVSDMIRRLAGAETLLSDAVNVANIAWDENSALNDEVAVRSATAESAINRLKNSFQVLKIEITDLYKDAVKNLANGLSNVFNIVSENIRNNRDFYSNLLRVTGAFVSLFATLKLGSIIFSKLLINVVSFTGIFKTLLMLFANPLILAGAFLAFANFDKILNFVKNDLKDVINSFNNFAKAIGDFLGSFFTLLSTVFTFNKDIQTTEEVFNNISESPIVKFFDGLTNKLTMLTDKFRDVVELINLMSNFNGLEDTITTVSTGVGQTYNVEAGDTLYEIARQNNMTLEELLALNPNIENPSFISIGQQLVLQNSVAETTQSLSRLEQIATNDIFGKIFGTDTTAIKNFEIISKNITDNLTVIKNGAGDFANAFRNIFSSDIETTLTNIKNSILEIASGIFGLFGMGVEKTFPEFTSDLAAREALFANPSMDGSEFATSSTITNNPFINKIQKEIEAMQKMDLSEFSSRIFEIINNIFSGAISMITGSDLYQEFISAFNNVINTREFDNLGLDVDRTAMEKAIELFFSGVVTGGLKLAFGTPGLIVGALITAIENDFLGIDTKLRESNVGTLLSDGIKGLNDIIQDALMGLFSGGNDILSPDNMALVDGFVTEAPSNNMIAKIFKPIADFINNINIDTTMFENVKNIISDIIGAVKTISEPIVNNLSKFIEQLMSFYNDVIGSYSGETTGQIQTIAEVISSFLDIFLGFANDVIGVGIEFIKSIIDDVVLFFDAVSRFFNSSATTDTRLTALGDFFKSLGNIYLETTLSTIDLVLVSLENLFGLELGSSQNVLENALLGVSELLNDIEVTILQVQLGWARLTNNTTEIDRISKELVANDFTNQVSNAFEKAALGGGTAVLDLTKDFNIFGNMLSLEDLEINPELASTFFDSLTNRGREAFLKSLDLSLASGEDIDKLAFYYEGILGDAFSKTQIWEYMFRVSPEAAREKASEMLNTLVNNIKTAEVELGATNPAESIVKGLFESLFGGVNNASGATPELGISNLGNALHTRMTEDVANIDYDSIGSDVVAGLNLGVSDNINGASLTFTNDVLSYVKEQFGIESPSTVFMAIGEFLLQGLVNGMNNKLPEYEDIIDNRMIPKIAKLRDEFRNAFFGMSMDIALFSVSFAVGAIATMITLDRFYEKFRSMHEIVRDFSGSLNDLGLILAQLGIIEYNSPFAGQQIEGRKFGGNVQSGKTYEILEDGLPFETFEASGKTYFISNTDGIMHSPANSRYTPESGGGGYYYNNVEQVTYNVPVTFENVPTNMSPQEIEKMAATIGNKIKNKLEGGQLKEKLRRRGMK